VACFGLCFSLADGGRIVGFLSLLMPFLSVKSPVFSSRGDGLHVSLQGSQSSAPVGAMATQRKRSSALVALGASAGVLFVAIAGGILSFPVFDAVFLPFVVKQALVARRHHSNACIKLGRCHDVVALRDDELQDLISILDTSDACGSKAVVVLNGDSGCGKSSIARRVLGTSGRPGLYVSFRSVETVQEALYSYLYYLFEPVGFLGTFVIAYVKVINAVMDLWAMNQVGVLCACVNFLPGTA
jgi:hypothetical protein